MLRVLVCTPDFPPARGGIQRLMGELAAHASRWDCRVVTLAHPAAVAAPLEQVTRRVGSGSLGHRADMARLSLATALEGWAWRPDAVLCGHVAASPGCVALGRLLGVPTVQYVYAKELLARPRLARWALRAATATVAVSNHAAALAVAAGADPTLVHVITPGVSAPARPGPRLADREGPPTILTVARLTDAHKGFDVMLRALASVRTRLPDARWVLVGDGPLRGELEQLARALAVADGVELRGQVGDDEVDAWFRRAHVFAMPSRVPLDGGGEGFGLVYLEAGARGLPCVAGKAGAVAEAVIDGTTGLLVDARDHVAVADALVRLLSEPELAARLGDAGRLRAQSLSWDVMIGQLDALVQRLVARR